MENISTTDSVFDRLVKILDTNCGYVDEEKAENVAKRLMRSSLIREEKPLVMTNADRIRSMTDEELADCFANFETRCYLRLEPMADCDTANFAKQLLEWLKEEFKDGSS